VIGRPQAELDRERIADRDVLLFDKWIEERETQAAESWRTRRARERSNGRSKNSGDLCVSAITIGAQA
jgi:hypothetical protein